MKDILWIIGVESPKQIKNSDDLHIHFFLSVILNLYCLLIGAFLPLSLTKKSIERTIKQRLKQFCIKKKPSKAKRRNHTKAVQKIIKIGPDVRFVYQTVLSGKEIRLVFEKSVSDREKNEDVTVLFPANCVLGRRHITLEVFCPEKNKIFANGDRLVTPVVFISMEKHTSFIRRVEIELPFISKINRFQNRRQSFGNFRKELIIEKETAIIKSFDFSPSAVAETVSI